jgi:hypothetical protein
MTWSAGGLHPPYVLHTQHKYNFYPVFPASSYFAPYTNSLSSIIILYHQDSVKIPRVFAGPLNDSSPCFGCLVSLDYQMGCYFVPRARVGDDVDKHGGINNDACWHVCMYVLDHGTCTRLPMNWTFGHTMNLSPNDLSITALFIIIEFTVGNSKLDFRPQFFCKKICTQ